VGLRQSLPLSSALFARDDEFDRFWRDALMRQIHHRRLLALDMIDERPSRK
jgi:hypothetical protein